MGQNQLSSGLRLFMTRSQVLFLLNNREHCEINVFYLLTKFSVKSMCVDACWDAFSLWVPVKGPALISQVNTSPLVKQSINSFVCICHHLRHNQIIMSQWQLQSGYDRSFTEDCIHALLHAPWSVWCVRCLSKINVLINVEFRLQCTKISQRVWGKAQVRSKPYTDKSKGVTSKVKAFPWCYLLVCMAMWKTTSLQGPYFCSPWHTWTRYYLSLLPGFGGLKENYGLSGVLEDQFGKFEKCQSSFQRFICWQKVLSQKGE